MLQKAGRREQTEAVKETTAEAMAETKKRLEDFVTMQNDFFGKCQEANRYWLKRMQAEASLTSEFTAKLTAARSVPDAMAAYQSWASRRIEMMMEDTQHLWDDAQKFLPMSAKGLGIST